MKPRSLGTDFHTDKLTDEQTDITNVSVAFRNFANAPKSGKRIALLSDC